MAEPIIDSIIDQEVDYIDYLEKQTSQLDVSKAKLLRLSRRVFDMRRDETIGKRKARKLFQKAFVGLTLMEYVYDIDKLKTMVDSHLESQFELIKKMNKRISSLEPIKKASIKERMLSRAR